MKCPMMKYLFPLIFMQKNTSVNIKNAVSLISMEFPKRTNRNSSCEQL